MLPFKTYNCGRFRISESSIDNAIGTLVGFGILSKSARYNSSNVFTLRYSLTPGEPIELRKKPLKPKDRKTGNTRKVFSEVCKF